MASLFTSIGGAGTFEFTEAGQQTFQQPVAHPRPGESIALLQAKVLDYTDNTTGNMDHRARLGGVITVDLSRVGTNTDILFAHVVNIRESSNKQALTTVFDLTQGMSWFRLEPTDSLSFRVQSRKWQGQTVQYGVVVLLRYALIDAAGRLV